ncbi:AEC family transporter [Alteribacter populi]|uniref:AEC family transporter n=1 Tax=Alteribacter populi TaxID=2011011 RepID=UPI000BBB206D|nr:AEC family transporter [Alteribacter populi]
MNYLVFIVGQVILPIFVLIGVGFIFQRKVYSDVRVLTKLNVYVFVPAFIFVTIYSTAFSSEIVISIVVFFLSYAVAIFLFVRLFSKALSIPAGKKTAITNGALFYNAGNYGIPVNDLVFKGDGMAMSIQVVFVALQNMLMFTYGIVTLKSAENNIKEALYGFLKMPILYALILGALFNIYSFSLPDVILVPSTYIANGMVTIALLTLGAQVGSLARTSWNLILLMSVAIRLLVGPMLALIIIFVFGFDGVIAKVMLIAASMPTSVNSAVLAQEYQSEAAFSSETVLYTTVFSSLTVTGTIYLANYLFS